METTANRCNRRRVHDPSFLFWHKYLSTDAVFWWLLMQFSESKMPFCCKHIFHSLLCLASFLVHTSYHWIIDLGFILQLQNVFEIFHGRIILVLKLKDNEGHSLNPEMRHACLLSSSFFVISSHFRLSKKLLQLNIGTHTKVANFNDNTFTRQPRTRHHQTVIWSSTSHHTLTLHAHIHKCFWSSREAGLHFGPTRCHPPYHVVINTATFWNLTFYLVNPTAFLQPSLAICELLITKTNLILCSCIQQYYSTW